jgi:hypothetical protein
MSNRRGQASKTSEQSKPDTNDPPEDRQEILEAAYQENLGKGNAPYAGVHFLTRGEVQWTLKKRVWSFGTDDEEGKRANLSGADFRETNLTGLFLRYANLSGANFRHSNFSGSILTGANLHGANLHLAILHGADVRGVRFDPTTVLDEIEIDTGTWLGDIRWNGVPLQRVSWEQAPSIGDESAIKAAKNRKERLVAYRDAARAYRDLGIALRSQGLLIPASNYRLREQALERKASFLSGNLLGWVFSWLLNLVAGYGERPVRSFVAYLLVIFGFAVAFFTIGSGVLGFGGHDAINSPLSALVFSVTSFHGRGFFPGGGLALDDPITILAAIEAVLGLFIEITFIATFTQRFFAR